MADENFRPALHTLHRAGLNATGRRSPSPPDAPHLDLVCYVYGPAICVRSGQESVSEATLRVLREAGVEARVDGLLSNGEPIPIFATLPQTA
jgi:hypothetical protein